jgi:hypothetical protein
LVLPLDEQAERPAALKSFAQGNNMPLHHSRHGKSVHHALPAQ